MGEQNKFLTARNMAGLTREQAAEKTYVSESTIKRIELGTQKCGADIAKALAKAYNAPWVADPTVPDNYTPVPKACAILRYINERDDVEQLMPRARRILADGKVDATEAEEFAEIVKEINEERAAARDLMYAV